MSDFWKGHSPVSRPGDDALAAIDALPSDIPSLQHAANQLVLHYMARKAEVLSERQPEINTRYVDAILTRLLSRGDGQTLSQPRAALGRTVGCCRDSALLLVSFARHKGYAARIRVGFAAYFHPTLMQDHTVAEIWDPETDHWRLIDADLPAGTDAKVDGEKIDLLSLRPGVDFQTAPQAWLRVRDGTAEEAQRYTGYEGAPPSVCGFPFISSDVLHDLAALDKKELLLWEQWGIRDKYSDALVEGEAALLDEIAAVTQHQDVRIEDVKKLLEKDQLKIPTQSILVDPYGAIEPKPVDISRVLQV